MMAAGGLRSCIPVLATVLCSWSAVLGVEATATQKRNSGWQSDLQALYQAHFQQVHEAIKLAGTECAGDKCAEDEAESRVLQINKAVTDSLPLSRTVPDTRPPICLSKKYSKASQAKTVSVVVVFNREATSTLLRTAQSVLDRTRPEVLLEVILVSDGPSKSPGDKKQKAEISAYCKKHPKVRLIKLPKHLGLAPAKNAGAKAAKGDILVFLDSHCEVNAGWYEPLAEAIAADRNAVLVPVIDEIGSQDFRYSPGAPARGVFTWGMYFAGQPFSEEDARKLDNGDSASMPIMPGGLFAIDRDYFAELGFYDEGLRIWGAENIELSLKTWRCGGRIELVPCSHVGHVYRSVGHHFPAGQSLHKNFRRIVEVWMDDYKHYYYESFPEAALTDTGDLTQALKARSRLRCESMDWFIKHVFPEMFIPRDTVQQGVLVSAAGGGCVDTRGVQIASNPMQDPHVAPVALDPCNPLSNHFYLMKNTGRLIHIGIWIEQCLGMHSVDDIMDETVQEAPVMLCQCAAYPGSGCAEDEIRWKWEPRTRRLRHVDSGRCLAVSQTPNPDGSGRLVASRDCGVPRGGPDARFRWSFVSHDELAKRLAAGAAHRPVESSDEDEETWEGEAHAEGGPDSDDVDDEDWDDDDPDDDDGDWDNDEEEGRAKEDL